MFYSPGKSDPFVIYTGGLLETTHLGMLSRLRPSVDREEQPHINKPFSSWNPGLVGDIPAHGRVMLLHELQGPFQLRSCSCSGTLSFGGKGF